MQHYDLIVIGLGSMGSATSYYASKRGAKVLGLEQFQIPHENGSHTGQSRIIRKAYFEHPNYVPLLQRAYDNWARLEQVVGRQLFYRTGLLYHGTADGVLLKGVRASSEQYHVPLRAYTPEQAQKRFPQFQLDTRFESLLEPDAGFILPEKTISIFYELALKAGATLHCNEAVQTWTRKGDGVEVQTNKASYYAKRLVITAGAWARDLIPALRPNLRVTQQSLFWVKPKDWEAFSLANFPCWNMMLPDDEGLFYGFPILPSNRFDGQIGLKIAYHAPEQLIEPNEARPAIQAKEYTRIQNFAATYMPDALASILASKTCLYTYSDNEDFIIDHLPEQGGVVSIACGFSGHGFKFVPLVGEVLTDLALEGKTDAPIGFLSAKRYLMA